MEKRNIKDILSKIESGEFTEEEEQVAKYWLFQLHNKNRAQLSSAKLDAGSKQIWERLKTDAPVRPVRMKIWPRIAVAASVILVLGFGLYFYSYNTSKDIQQSPTLISDIGPGGNKAYLTLANGKRIALSDATNGTVAKESNVEIIKAADGQLVYSMDNKVSGSSGLMYNTIETPKGGKYEITLPDGTHVWLNSSSTLKYPASFSALKERKVELKGEAYFEVAHHKSVPFKVTSSGQTVEVLGTHFNINSYLDEGTVKTTLLEGSVSVYLNNSKEFKLLKPGEQADKTGEHIAVSKANMEQAMGWKNGDFVFKGEDVKAVMRQLERWYDVDVEYQGNVSDIGFVSTISRSKKLADVIKVLQMTEGIHFKIEGRRVLVMP